MLHYLDDLDSKMEAMRAQFERESTLDGPWTSYNPSLGRPLLNTEKFLAPKKQVLEQEPVRQEAVNTNIESPDQPILPDFATRR